jgi:cobalt-zinc-cadmium efflux system outer membrane protein
LFAAVTGILATPTHGQRPDASPGATRPPVSVPVTPTPAPLPGPAATNSDAPRAAVSAVLTIGELEQIAMENNPTLAQAAYRVEAIQGEQLQVGLYPNPVIGYQAEEIGDTGSAGQHGMFFSQEIVTANKLGLNRAVASHQVQQAEWEFEMQRQRLVNGVRTRAYEVMAAQRTLALAEELVKIGKAATDTAEQLNKARQVSQVDVLQARVEANSARLQLVAARKTHAAAWRQLAAVVGVPEMEPAPLAGQLEDALPELAWNDSVSALLTGSPQLAWALAGVERAQAAVAQACAQRTPNIETFAAVRHNDNSNSTNASLMIGVPLMIHNRNQGNIMRAQAELAAAQHEVKRVELLLQEQLASSFRDYEVAREQVDQYRRDILPDATRSLELVRTGYQQGEFGYLQLLTAQQTYSRTNLAYVDRLRELRLRAVEIQGMLLTGGLQAPGQ